MKHLNSDNGPERIPDGPCAGLEHRALWLAAILALAAVALRLFYWQYTHRTWEDAYIAYRHAVHAIDGLGLSYNVGGAAHTQGFTSPLGVLIPLLGECLHRGWGLPMLKATSVVLAAATIFILNAWGALPSVRFPLPLRFVLLGYVAIEHHQILAGMGGMETAWVTFAFSVSVYALARGNARLQGASLGLGLLARPDFAVWAGPVLLWLAVRERKALPLTAGIAGALYGPWLLFATAYYGTPVPNSLLAKQLNVPHWYELLQQPTVERWLHYGGLVLRKSILAGLEPAYAGHGTHPYFFAGPADGGVIPLVLLGGVLIGTVAACLRRDAVLPVAGGVWAYIVFYLFAAPVVTFWYRASFSVPLLLLGLYGFHAMFGPGVMQRWPARTVLWLLSIAYIAGFAMVLPRTFEADRQIQRWVDGGVRQAAGEYLRGQMQPGDTLACEPLGYVGFFAGSTVYDWPGIGSREVTNFSREKRRSLEEIIQHFSPSWVLLRAQESAHLQDPEGFAREYQETTRFSVPPEANLPFREYSVDTEYRVFQKAEVKRQK